MTNAGHAVTVLVAALVSALLVRGLLVLAGRGSPFIPLDRPNHRSLHARPVPRAGGLAVLGAFLLLAGWNAGQIPGLLAGVLLVAVVSYVDDLRGLPPVLRLATHLVAAVIVLWPSDPSWAVIPLAICLAGFANLINFMDGANGLVPTCLAIAGGLLGQAAATIPSPGMAALCLTFAGAMAGFLIFNLSGRIFLGDVGSVSLGFLFVSLAAFGIRAGVWPVTLVIFTVLPILVDTLSTLARRALRREHIWLPHREHLYQRLIECGWSHRRVTGCYGAATLIAGGLGLLTQNAANETRIGALSVAMLVALMLHDAGLRYCARKWRAVPASGTDA